MGFRLRAVALPAFVCAVAISMASVAGSAAAAKAVAKGRGITVSPARGGAMAGRATSILGAAWKADNTPIPAAKIRLRNVLTGRIEATSVANDLGQFAFEGMESGSYVIELVSDSGKILAMGHPFTVASGETIATFVRLAARSPWFSGFFGNAASGLAAVAASTGVTAVAPEEMACASPPCSQ